MSFTSIRSILDKMDNEDSDYRYMATSDLLEYLSKSGLRACDEETQLRLCKAIVRLLSDSSSEVQGMAQKCLPPLVFHVEDRHAVYIIEKLLDFVIRDIDPAKDCAADPDAGGSLKSLRDVAALGLKSILSELPMGKATPPAPSIAENMLPRLLVAIARSNAKVPAELQIESLELLQALLSRLGPLVASRHDAICGTVLDLLWSSRPVVCKRAIGCLAVLVPVCSRQVFADVIVSVSEKLDPSAGAREKTRRAVQAIWALSKTAGHRMAPDVATLAPRLLSFCSAPDFEEDDELRENCLHALQSFVERCPREMTHHVDGLVKVLIALSRYDPNYAESDEDDHDEQDGMFDDGEAPGPVDDEMFVEDDEEDDFSDDDDLSWKVRRAAVKCIFAAITVQLRPVPQLFEDFGDLLIRRFKEREENVKLDVFAAYRALLKQASVLCSHSGEGATSPTGDPMLVEHTYTDSSSHRMFIFSSLEDRSPRIVRSIKKELSARSVKTRISAMSLFREFVVIAPVSLAPLVAKVMPELHRGLADSSAQMKTETLLVLRGVVERGGIEALKCFSSDLIIRVLETADDRYYKITAESLRLCSSILIAFAKRSISEVEGSEVAATTAAKVHAVALRRLTAQDQDSKVKEAALECIGTTVAMYGDHLGTERRQAIAPVLCDRLNNEVTRLATVRTLIRIAESDQSGVLTPVLERMTNTVGSFLRKSNPTLRLAALEFLGSSPALSPDNEVMLLSNVSDLVVETDLRLTSLAIRMCARLVRSRGSPICSLIARDDGVYGRMLSMAVSPLLQGRAVDSLLDFFTSLAELNASPLKVDCMLQSLQVKAIEYIQNSSSGTARVGSSSSFAPVHTTAKCIAVICQASATAEWSEFGKACVRDVSCNVPATRMFALACVGELGRRSLLGIDEVGKDQAQAAILAALDVAEEEIKAAAALALGGLASGDDASGIPNLIELIRSRPENRYLLLLSLRDAIAFSKTDDVSSFTGILLQVLREQGPELALPIEHALNRSEPSLTESRTSRGSGQESIRIATAECLGLLAQVNPDDVLPALKQSITSDSPSLRASIVAAIKYVVSSGPAELVPSAALDAGLRAHVNAFLMLADDADVTVRRNAMQTINAIARFHPALLIPHLGGLLPLIYKSTVKDKHLIRKVDLGPFKYEEDFGLDLRKATFDCMRTMIAGSLSPLIPLTQYLERVVDGLTDLPDVRAICQLILGTVAGLPAAPAAMLSMLDKIVSALSVTLNERLKDNAVRQEKERHDDSLKGALRTVHVLAGVPEISQSPVFVSFMDKTIRTERLADKYDALVRKDNEGIRVSSPYSLDGDTMRD